MRPPLKPMRVAESFERLRDAADAFAGAAKSVPGGDRGRFVAHRAASLSPATFSRPAGLRAIADAGAASGEESATRFLASGAEMACLCGSDVDYALHAQNFARALKGAGANYLMLAGRPGENEAALSEAGVDGFVFAGQDAVAVLQSLLTRAGAAV